MKEPQIPTVFISYCWKKTNLKDKNAPVDQENLKRVKAFADHLRENGMEVLLDLYHLKPGDDRFVYMEMIANKNITHVLSLCEQEYQEKFDARAGGVGVEAFIMSPDLYGELSNPQSAKKFIPIIWEKGPEGKVFLPVAMRSKMYVDLVDNADQNLKSLVRFIHNEPEFKQPPLGKKPRFD